MCRTVKVRFCTDSGIAKTLSPKAKNRPRTKSASLAFLVTELGLRNNRNGATTHPIAMCMTVPQYHAAPREMAMATRVSVGAIAR